jgi:hypothetical protein
MTPVDMSKIIFIHLITILFMEEGRVGPVENKLLSFPTVQGMVFGSFGETSEAVHSLVRGSCH